MRRIALVLAAVFVLSVMVATAAPAMADDNWRGGHNWSWDKDHHKKKKKHHKDRHHKHWNPWWWGSTGGTTTTVIGYSSLGGAGGWTAISRLVDY